MWVVCLRMGVFAVLLEFVLFISVLLELLVCVLGLHGTITCMVQLL